MHRTRSRLPLARPTSSQRLAQVSLRMLQQKKDLELIEPNKQRKKKNYKNSGILQVLQCDIVKEYSYALLRFRVSSSALIASAQVPGLHRGRRGDQSDGGDRLHRQVRSASSPLCAAPLIAAQQRRP